MDYSGKRVSIIGLGRSGYCAAKMLMDLGAFVFVSDSGYSPELEAKADELRNAGASVELGAHTDTVYRIADEIVVSPGVPANLGILREAERARPYLSIIPEIELGFRVTKGKIVGITGSNGKSTTVSLLGEIFKAAGRDYNVVGNIGRPLCDVALSATPDTIHCVELSSFQLEKILDFRPHVACILNLSADHLDRHETEMKYFEAKERIFANQTAADYSVLSMDDPKVAMLASKVYGRVILFGNNDLGVTGCFVRNGKLTMKDLSGNIIELVDSKELGIPGPHNVSNACAAVACALPFEVSPEACRTALHGFTGLEHRMEKVGESRGVLFVNDSKATNIDSLVVALKSYSDNIILIAGGYDKGADFSEVRELVAERVKAAVLIGVTADKIEAAWAGATKTIRASSLEEAVNIAALNAGKGDVVLLSPGCASYDMFKNFEDRGRQFVQIVQRLISVK